MTTAVPRSDGVPLSFAVTISRCVACFSLSNVRVVFKSPLSILNESFVGPDVISYSISALVPSSRSDAKTLSIELSTERQKSC